MGSVNDAAARHIGAPQLPSARWQTWLSRHVPALQGPLVDPARRLVVVAPHPDDEVLACALLMQQHAACGGALHLVGVTDGEASHSQADLPPPDLHALRSRERREGLVRLGLGHMPMTPLHLPDGGVAEAGARLHAALLALLRPGDALVTTWHLDGHPDHECCGRVAMDVARRLSLPLLQAPVWMWHWAEPAMPRIPWHQLYAMGAPALARMCKAAALQAHQSQLSPRSASLPAVLDSSILERALWPHEYFFIYAS
ncbi:PIG-L deacetylase family protein [Pulveribacter suum]|uniref:PIG-L family deacetylase n=1 Tax=Pulveribacter suum TaxID=2116657 RepID=A0A2P1NP05_9BURK|nr:PIG-L family deacetylase [Pulveribacter suum]AVP58788.1 PIG-L family deacetylase [Pulveribacter suum]